MTFPATSQPLGDFSIAVAGLLTDAQTELKEQQALGAACKSSSNSNNHRYAKGREKKQFFNILKYIWCTKFGKVLIFCYVDLCSGWTFPDSLSFTLARQNYSHFKFQPSEPWLTSDFRAAFDVWIGQLVHNWTLSLQNHHFSSLWLSGLRTPTDPSV